MAIDDAAAGKAWDGDASIASAQADSTTGTYFTKLYLTSEDPSPDRIATFVDRVTPGNVAVCLSGGGSRSFAAGIGQLQALRDVQVNGRSLLSLTRAISTVSGGGWIGIPFVFLPANVSDDAFLGTYAAPSILTYDLIDTLPPSGIANQITSDFSIPALVVMAGFLVEAGVPTSDLWQVLMGIHFLAPYGLYDPDANNYSPTTFFSDDTASLTTILDGNSGLSAANAHLVSQAAGQDRPYLVSLSSLSVSDNGQQGLVPVHSTPFVTGVLATPPGAHDGNGRQVGGGGVWSFAFDSDPVRPTNDLTRIMQASQWSLTDALGTSSAAFAEDLIAQAKQLLASPTRLATALRLHGPAAIRKLAHGPEDAARMRIKLEQAMALAPAGAAAPSDLHRSLRALVLESIVPAYQYWSPVDPPLTQPVNPSMFADGGNLENTGIASMLSYQDIDNIIAFLNTETPLSMDDNNVIVVDDCIPPLFGYEPYDPDNGYLPLKTGTVYQHNQVFDCADFEPLLNGLWTATNSDTTGVVFSQTLTPLANSWYGVTTRGPVTIVWSYLNYSAGWYNAIQSDVVAGVVDFQYEFEYFPNYWTTSTQLTKVQINLLASMTAWTIRDSGSASAFTALYSG